jgi:hypothetical protein
MARKDRCTVLGNLMAGPVGREWVWDHLAQCGIFNSTIADHHVMSYLEGKRSVGLRMFSDIQSDGGLRKLFAKAQDENIRKTEDAK